MHTGRRYTPVEFLKWTIKDIIVILSLACVPTIIYIAGFKFIALPWPPIAILGTSVAFIVGFKNNAAYNRTWEARQIYGSIINDSRSFAYSLRDALGPEHKETVMCMFYRHFAWLTALRFALREPRPWENMTQHNYEEFRKNRYVIPEIESSLEVEMGAYLMDEDLQYVMSKKNKATQLTALQSAELGRLRQEGLLSDIQWTMLVQCLHKFSDGQGRAERIKNFPYPRNFSSIATYLLLIFVALVPFALLREMDKAGDGTFLQGHTIWFNIPFAGVIAWVFHTLDTVGESSMNPFEGSPNDVPITQISRTIEIDMRDMLDESTLPQPILASHSIVL